MHTRKHTGGPRRRNSKGILVLALILLLGLAIGGTIAFLTTQTGNVENAFTPTKVEIQIDERISNNAKTSITIANPKGDDKVPCYVRVALTESWVITAEGENNGQICAKPHEHSYSFELGENWVKHGNYYYYKLPVAVGSSTGNLIKNGSSIAMAQDTTHGCVMQVEVVASAVQSDGVTGTTKAVVDAWGLDPSALS